MAFEILSAITPFFGDDICNDTIFRKLATMGNNEHTNLIKILIDQNPPSKNSTYSMYKVNILNNEASHHLDIDKYNYDADQYYNTIQCDDQNIFLHILSVDSMLEYIEDNCHKKYLYFPVVFGSEVHKFGHFSVIIFDIAERKVYMVDPNGRSSFFDNMLIKYIEKTGNKELEGVMLNSLYNNLHIDGVNLVNKLIEQYVHEFNFMSSINFRFIPSSDWNKNNLVINRTFPKSCVINSGNCVMMTTLLIHLTHLFQDKEIKEIYHTIAEMPDEELIHLINGYSVGVYNLFMV